MASALDNFLKKLASLNRALGDEYLALLKDGTDFDGYGSNQTGKAEDLFASLSKGLQKQLDAALDTLDDAERTKAWGEMNDWLVDHWNDTASSFDDGKDSRYNSDYDESIQARMGRLLGENAEEDTAADNAQIERLSRMADVGLEAVLNKLQGKLGKDLGALGDLLIKFGGSEGKDAEEINKRFNDAVGAVHLLRQVTRKHAPR